MVKTWQTRFKQTVDFIGTKVPAEKIVIEKFLTTNNFLNNEAFSTRMSIGGMLQSAQAKTERAMKRAIILIDGARNHPTRTPGLVKNLTGGILSQEFDANLLRLRFLADQSQFGTGRLLISAFQNHLKADPRSWLSRNELHIFGSAANQGLVNVVDAYFSYNRNGDKFAISGDRPNGIPNYHSFKAVSIPAVAWCDVPGRTGQNPSFAQIAATELTGADVVISTQFSGCSFCFKEFNGRLFAAHIMPDDQDPNVPNAIAGGGSVMAKQIAGTIANVTGGEFSAPVPGGGTVHVYGAGYSNIADHATGYPPTQNRNYMTMIGFRSNGTWKIYTQHVSENAQAAFCLYPLGDG